MMVDISHDRDKKSFQVFLVTIHMLLRLPIMGGSITQSHPTLVFWDYLFGIVVDVRLNK